MRKHQSRSGLSRTSEYFAWWNMNRRCTRPSARQVSYARKGIRVCPEWRESFAAFLDYIGPKPTLAHELDRIDNDGDYQPGNVRWATRIENRRNKGDLRILTYQGVSQPMVDWAAALGIDVRILWKRLDRGWSVARAIATGKGARGRPRKLP
jgi:hypothetical protein